jgi:hypothetical protein
MVGLYGPKIPGTLSNERPKPSLVVSPILVHLQSVKSLHVQSLNLKCLMPTATGGRKKT